MNAERTEKPANEKKHCCECKNLGNKATLETALNGEQLKDG